MVRIMGRMSADTRARVIWMWRAKFSVANICTRLREEDIKVSRKSIYHLLKKHRRTGSIADLKRAPRSRKLNNEHFRFIDEAMEANPQLTSRQLHGLVVERFPAVSSTSVNTVNRARQALGWDSKKNRYCAMIGEIN